MEQQPETSHLALHPPELKPGSAKSRLSITEVRIARHCHQQTQASHIAVTSLVARTARSDGTWLPFISCRWQRGEMGTKDDLKRLERELERSHKQASEISAPETARPLLPPAKGSKQHSSLDLILGLAAALAVVGLGVNTVRQMPDQQAKTLRDGLIGSAAGLLVGYGVGRFRP